MAVAATVAAVLGVGATVALAGSPGNQPSTVTYTATQKIPVPPAANFAGNSGGDGWAVALTGSDSSVFPQAEVFNVFHHQTYLAIACHLQQIPASPASDDCWTDPSDDPVGYVYITDTTATGADHNSAFATSGQPGLYLDQSTGDLYVYATRESDNTGGVVCIDTQEGGTSPAQFCGFTPLTTIGGAGPVDGTDSALSDGVLIGNDFYAFNYYTGAAAGNSENQLLCFDVSTDAPCANQPFDLNIGAGTVSASDFPPPAVAAIGDQVIVPVTVDGTDELACWDDTTQATCQDSYPIDLGFTYDSESGGAFPLLTNSGQLAGFCLPTGSDPCYSLDGDPAATPQGMASVIGGTEGWDGPGLAVGPRVYVPDGYTNQVLCFDYSTNQTCGATSGDCTSQPGGDDPSAAECTPCTPSNCPTICPTQSAATCTGGAYPLSMQNLGLLYTVNSDPQRPTCLWVNSDNGADQIQAFDAYSGGACGAGAIRVVAQQFVVNNQACYPDTYQSLSVIQPPPSGYQTGTIQFADDDGNPLTSIPSQNLVNGTVNLSGLNLPTGGNFPQFIISLQNGSQEISDQQVEVQLTYTASYDSACTSTSITATPPATSPAVQTVTLPGSTVTQTVTVTTPTTTTIRQASVPTTCPAPIGAIGGTSVGVLSVGMTQTQARETLLRYHVTENRFDNFCLYHGWGIRLGYPTSALLKSVPAAERSTVKNHVVLALTANPFYALDGVRPGVSVSSVAKQLHLGKVFHVGSNDWYFGTGVYARGIVKVRGGVIQEVGLANVVLTQTRAQQSAFIHSFDKL